MGKTLERKFFALKLDAPPDAEGKFSGYAAVFGNVDKGNDVVDSGAVTKTLQENPEVPIFWVHNYVKVPIGIGRMVPDGKGVRIDGELFLETSELAREVFGAMRAGAVKGLSIGYNTLKRTFKGAIRHLQEITIGEVSLCPFPMNPLAEVDGVKDLYGYEQTEGVGCLLTMIRCGADFLVGEVEEGDTDDAGRMQSILTSLAKLLVSELGEVATDAADDDESPDVVYVYDEGMAASVDNAIKQLEALRTRDGATEAAEGVDDPDRTEPATATLRALLADVRAA
jgi:HK97 family phage prohead protease